MDGDGESGGTVFYLFSVLMVFVIGFRAFFYVFFIRVCGVGRVVIIEVEGEMSYMKLLGCLGVSI